MFLNRSPLSQKAMSILSLVNAICDAVEADDEDKTEDPFKIMLRNGLEFMRSDAHIIPAKIAGAEGTDLFSLKMENAVIIKRAACDVRSATYTPGLEEQTDKKYLEMLRNEIEEFKELFVQWVQSFDRTNDIDDGWGLWN